MRNIGKKKIKNNNDKIFLNLRLVVFAVVFSIVCLILIGRLSYIQFIKGEEYSQAAYNNQMKNKIISPKRGTIFDVNGEILALSVSVDTISLNPGKVCYKNGKDVEPEIIAE